MRRIKIFKISAVCLVCVFALSFSLPSGALAYRSNTGGGEASNFDVGTFAMGTAIGMASSFAGSAISGGIGVGLDNTNSIATMSSAGNFMNSALNSWGTSYTTSFANNQLSRAIQVAGNHYDWGGEITTGISTLGTSALSGAASGNIGSGLAEGAVKGGILYSAADSRGQYDPWIGMAAGVAGDFAGGTTSGTNFGNAMQVGLGDAVQSVPSHLLSVAASSMTEDKSMMDRYVINQAFSGAYSVTGSLGGAMATEGFGLPTSYTIGSGGFKNYYNGKKGVDSAATGSGIGISTDNSSASPYDPNIGAYPEETPDLSISTNTPAPIAPFNPNVYTGVQIQPSTWVVPVQPLPADAGSNSN
ncbi:MAG: hypothetical protein NT060_04645 [Candidatus Omnitrophica bacterium]|nr:hypothetical protein [Candidatus Omnitrophota bacterium]